MGTTHNPVDEAAGLAEVPSILAKRRYRLTFDLTVQLSDITPADVHRVTHMASNYDEIIAEEWVWRYARHQRELLLALAARPDIVERLFRQVLSSCIEDGTLGDRLRDVDGLEPQNDEEIFAPLFDSLSTQARKYFRGAIRKGLYPEQSEHIFHAIDSSIHGVSLTMVPE